MAKKKHAITLQSLDPNVSAEDLKKVEDGEEFGSPLIKSIVNSLNRSGDTITRLSFEIDPSTSAQYGGLWYEKQVLIPDSLLKRISMTSDLVGAIRICSC